MSYLRYLCLFTYSVVQHKLCCVFVLFFFFLSMLPVSLDCPFLIGHLLQSNVYLVLLVFNINSYKDFISCCLI